MMKRVPALVSILAATSLASCDSASGSAAGAVSEGEAQALQEAAEMLEARQLPQGTLPPTPQEELATEPAEQPLQEEPSE